MREVNIISGNSIGDACRRLASRVINVVGIYALDETMFASTINVVIGIHQTIPASWLGGNAIIGFHPTLLPHGRGGSPIQRQILEDAPAGITFFRMTTEIDAGNILGQVALPRCRTSAEYYEACREAAPTLLDLVLKSDLRGVPQALLPVRKRITDDDQRAMDPEIRARVYTGPYEKYLLEEYRK